MKKRYIFCIIAAFLLIAFMFLIFGSSLPLQIKQNFAIGKGTAVDLSLSIGECPELETMTDTLDLSQIYLVGETHGVAKNYDLQFRYLSYLCKTQNIKYIILETGFSASQILNVYLKTGDEEILDYVMQQLEGSFAYSNELADYIKNVYTLNRTLASDKKLQFIGIDAEQQSGLVGSYISKLLPTDKPVPESIQTYIASLKQTPQICQSYDFMQSLYSSLYSHKAAYVQYLGDYYNNFYFCVSNSLDFMTNKITARRDEVLTRNFCEIYTNMPKGKYFGQLGLLHVLQPSASQITVPFATAVANSLPELDGKIFRIILRYANCSYLHPTNGILPVNDFSLPITSNIKNGIYFYDFEKSIALQNAMREEIKPARYGDCTVLIVNSPAVSTYIKN